MYVVILIDSSCEGGVDVFGTFDTEQEALSYCNQYPSTGWKVKLMGYPV